MVDMEVLDKLLKEVDWKTHVIKRHHKFIERYLEVGSLSKMGDFAGLPYEVSQLKEIFNRIHNQLAPHSKSHVPLLKEEYKKVVFNPKGKGTAQGNRLTALLEIVDSTPNWREIVTERQAGIISSILDIKSELKTFSWSEVASKINGNPDTMRESLSSKSKYSALSRLNKYKKVETA